MSDLLTSKVELREKINASPILQSLLYDIDLLPEQLEENDVRRWGYIAAIVGHFESALAPADGWVSVKEFPPMSDPDDDGHPVSEPLLVYVACQKRIAFGECRQRSPGPYFRAHGFSMGFNITHWRYVPPPPAEGALRP